MLIIGHHSLDEASERTRTHIKRQAGGVSGRQKQIGLPMDDFPRNVSVPDGKPSRGFLQRGPYKLNPIFGRKQQVELPYPSRAWPMVRPAVSSSSKMASIP